MDQRKEKYRVYFLAEGLSEKEHKVCYTLIIRETYKNLGTKLLPRNFFNNMFVKVCNNMC